MISRLSKKKKQIIDLSTCETLKQQDESVLAFMTEHVDRKDQHVGCFNPFDRIEGKESEEEEEQPDGPYPDHCTC